MKPARGLTLHHATTIEDVPAVEWDGCLGDRGAFAVDGLRFLERLFGPHQPPENRWDFHYYRVLDDRGRPVLATFFTETLWKDDLFAPAEVSAAAEERRSREPYYATSRIFAMGSLLTEGNHLFLDRDAKWRPALDLLLGEVRRRAGRSGAKAIVLRDLPASDVDVMDFLTGAGFSADPLPPSSVLHLRSDWSTDEEFLVPLKKKFRQVLRNKVFRWNPHYSVRVLSAATGEASPKELAHFYELYRAVHSRSFALNTFPLPNETFQVALRAPGWELLVLSLRPELSGPHTVTVAVILSFVGRRHYAPIVVGLDYRYVPSHSTYRQTLWREILRARELGVDRVQMGLGAPVEKARFGCRAVPIMMLYSTVSAQRRPYNSMEKPD